MTFSHGDASGDHDLVGIMHDPVHDCIRNWTIIVRFQIDALTPARRLVLSAEYH